MKATAAPERTTKGQMHQNMPLHVEFSTNAAAKKGPIVFPSPTQEPNMPWYLREGRQHNLLGIDDFTHFPRFSSVTISDTIIIASAVIPPFPTPEIPRKAYS